METIIRQKAIKKVITDHYIDEPVYIINGKEFTDLKEAQDYENELLLNTTFNKDFSVEEIYLDGYYTAIFITELNDKVKNLLCKKFYHLDSSELKIGWNLIQVDDSGDYTFTTCRHINEVIQSHEADLKILRELLNKRSIK